MHAPYYNRYQNVGNINMLEHIHICNWLIAYVGEWAGKWYIGLYDID